MKNKSLPFSIMALATLLACSSHNQKYSEESYRDDTFLRLLSDSTGIVEERLLSADGNNGFVYFYEFYNLLPSDMDFEDENMKYMCDFYNFNQIDNSSFTGYDTYDRARFALGSDSLQLLNAWKANLEWLRGRRVCYDSTVQQWLSGAIKARIDVLNNGNADKGGDREGRLYVGDLLALMTQWNPMNDVAEESKDSVWEELQNSLSPQNYLPDNFTDVYKTFLNIDTPAIAQDIASLFKCYNSAKIQYLFLCSENDILKVGEYPYGNQSAAEVINLFWKGVVL